MWGHMVQEKREAVMNLLPKVEAAIGLLAATCLGAFDVANSTTFINLHQEDLEPDPEIQITLQGHISQGGDGWANATVYPGREASGSNPIICDDLTASDLVYGAFIEESTPSAWPVGRICRVQVFGDGVLVATLYFQNNNPRDNSIE